MWLLENLKLLIWLICHCGDSTARENMRELWGRWVGGGTPTHYTLQEVSLKPGYTSETIENFRNLSMPSPNSD